MKKAYPYILLSVVLTGIVFSGIACHLIFPFQSVSVQNVKPYFCSATIYRDISSTQEFTEEWEYYAWPDEDYGICIAGDADKLGKECTSDGSCGSNGDCNNNGTIDQADVIKYCTKRLDEYISDYMAPGFSWGNRNLTAAAISKEHAADCSGVLAPPTYGAPLGAEVRWNFPPANEASVWIALTDKDGFYRTAEPTVKTAYADFAERTGLPDLSSGGTYVLGKRHIRASDLFLEVNTPFDLGDLKVTKLYVQSVGTVIAEDTGANLYKIFSGKAKFFFYASGEKEGEGAVTSFCFVNGSVQGITEYQGPPYSFFALSLNLTPPDFGIGDLFIKVSLSKPAAFPPSFKTHQPSVALADRETTDQLVDLSADSVFDHDNDISKFLWFENFEAGNEIFLGEGQTLSKVYFPRGDHEITVVVYDAKGSYNSDTMLLKVKNAVPIAADDAYSLDEDTALNVSAPGVLANDTDANGDSLTAKLVGSPSSGVLTLNNDGAFNYKPNPNYYGKDSFTYMANDGADNSNVATVTITVIEVTPQEETNNLQDMVDDLSQAGALNQGQANSLKSKLQAAIAKLNSGNVNAACNILQAFINAVQSFIADGVLNTTQGQPLIDKANNIRAELGC